MLHCNETRPLKHKPTYDTLTVKFTTYRGPRFVRVLYEESNHELPWCVQSLRDEFLSRLGYSAGRESSADQ